MRLSKQLKKRGGRPVLQPDGLDPQAGEARSHQNVADDSDGLFGWVSKKRTDEETESEAHKFSTHHHVSFSVFVDLNFSAKTFTKLQEKLLRFMNDNP